MSGEEDGGYTILEFTRSLTTCDDKDLNIQVANSSFIMGVLYACIWSTIYNNTFAG